MNKKECFIFILLSLILGGGVIAQTNVTLGEKKVSVVVYTPFDFYSRLMDAFKCGSEQDYYVVTADKTL